MTSHLTSLIFSRLNAEQVIFVFASLSELLYLVPVSIEDEQTGIISSLAGLQSLNSLSQFILNHLQTNKQRDKIFSKQESTVVQLPVCVHKEL